MIVVAIAFGPVFPPPIYTLSDLAFRTEAECARYTIAAEDCAVARAAALARHRSRDLRFDSRWECEMSAGIDCAPARTPDPFDGFKQSYGPNPTMLWFTVRMNKGSPHQIVSGRPVYASLLNAGNLYEKSTVDSSDARRVWPAMETEERHRGADITYFRRAAGFAPAADLWRDRYWGDNLLDRGKSRNDQPASIAPHL